MFGLAAAFPLLQPPAPVQHTILDIMKEAAAIVGAVTVLGGGFLWLVLPRIKDWLRSEIAAPVQATHKSVTVNGGKSNPPTMLDKVHILSDLVEQLIAASGANAQRSSDLADSLDDVRELAAEARDLSKQTRDEFRVHEAEGEQYLGKVRLVMKASGIDLPDTRDT